MATAAILDLRPEAAPQSTLGNPDIELLILGILLYDNDALERVEGLRPEHFHEPILGAIYAEIEAEVRAGRLAEPLLISEKLSRHPAYTELGGIRFLADLVDRAPPSVSAGEYARVIRDLATRRELVRVGEEIAGRARDVDPEADGKGQVELAERDLYVLSQSGGPRNGFRAFGGYLTEAMDTALAAYKRGGGVSGLATGLADLDRKLGGFHPSDLIVLAARPSMGKTSLATNIAYNVARAGEPVGFFSLEMSGEQLAMRVLAEASGVQSDKIRRGEVAGPEFTRLRDISEEIGQLPIHIDQTGGASIASIVTRARRLKRTHGIKLLVIDYLQLATTDGRRRSDNRTQEVSEITQGLKALAKDLNLPVLALSQLSRQVESRDDKRPMLSDLRESGSIEQDADVVMFIYREAYYLGRSEPPEGTEKHRVWQDRMGAVAQVADVIIGKQRHGPIGTVKLHFDEKLTKFSNLARENEYARVRYSGADA